MYNKSIDFDIEISDYLSKRGYVRRRQLLLDLLDMHKNDGGYSEKSINRKLYSMKKRCIISIIVYKDLHKFGIKENDKRSSYLTLKRTEKITEHIDNVIDKISSDNPIQQKMALKELERYGKQHVLTPKQLDILVSQLDTEDIDLIDHILRLVYTYIDKKNIEPSNKSETVMMLRTLLNKYPEPLLRLKNFRTHFIYLLGHYKDNAVIERLKKDAEELDTPRDVIHDYESYYTANIIEEHRGELYDFEEELRLKGKEEPAQFIAEIRVRAMIHLGMYDDPFKDNVRGW